MPNLIEFINAINQTKQDLMVDEQARKDYMAYVVNRGMSQWIDTVLFASEMNKRPGLSKEMQNTFYLRSVRKNKRYGKWAKVFKPTADVMVIAKYFEVNYDKAVESINILGDDVIAIIIEKIKTKDRNYERGAV
ncbi:MAG: DNA polymerase clamp loader subunit A [Candidatus Peribacteraceae bacterium]|nr:DNA polymerase clamp loader subunit A [Candidatus Peribacteraceae bacterium]